MPFEWTINPYRGCEFGCKYCYARYTHEFMELRAPLDFERAIFAKEFDARAFSRELRAVKAEDWIAIGTATDPYQPAERRYCLTQRVLEVFLRREGFQLAITTKSDLVARDAELLAAVGVRNRVRVNITVTTLDAGLARLLEPMAPTAGSAIGSDGGIDAGGRGGGRRGESGDAGDQRRRGVVGGDCAGGAGGGGWAHVGAAGVSEAVRAGGVSAVPGGAVSVVGEGVCGAIRQKGI